MASTITKNIPIIIETSGVVLTFRCNLRCKLCCTGTPQRTPDKQVDFPLESLQKALKRHFEVVQFTRKLAFGGGEPTLHRNLPELIDYASQFSKQFEVLEIITNGAAMPRADILDIAEKHRDIIFFLVDDYGSKISKKANAIAEELEKREIRHTVRCYHGSSAHAGGWGDLGDFTHKHNQDEAKELLASCIIASRRRNHTGIGEEMSAIASNSFFIPYAVNTNGLLHHCARAHTSLEMGVIQKDKNFVDLLDNTLSIEEMQKKIIEMFSADYYPACEFCNGFNEKSDRYEPAEQLSI